MTLYREVTGDEDEAWYADEAYRPRMIRAWLVPVESVNIRWCMSHRRETWSGRTTCVGMGGDLTNSCNVVDALLMVGEDSTP